MPVGVEVGALDSEGRLAIGDEVGGAVVSS